MKKNSRQLMLLLLEVVKRCALLFVMCSLTCSNGENQSAIVRPRYYSVRVRQERYGK